jgi:hypothetical protein
MSEIIDDGTQMSDLTPEEEAEILKDVQVAADAVRRKYPKPKLLPVPYWHLSGPPREIFEDNYEAALEHYSKHKAIVEHNDRLLSEHEAFVEPLINKEIDELVIDKSVNELADEMIAEGSTSPRKYIVQRLKILHLDLPEKERIRRCIDVYDEECAEEFTDKLRSKHPDVYVGEPRHKTLARVLKIARRTRQESYLAPIDRDRAERMRRKEFIKDSDASFEEDKEYYSMETYARRHNEKAQDERINRAILQRYGNLAPIFAALNEGVNAGIGDSVEFSRITKGPGFNKISTILPSISNEEDSEDIAYSMGKQYEELAKILASPANQQPGMVREMAARLREKPE